MVSYSLLRSHAISTQVYEELSAILDGERGRHRDRRVEAEGGPDYYVVKRHRLGLALVNLVGRMVAGGTLSTTKAGKVLGVKPTAVERLVGNRAA
jgi:hypothetical protein